MDIHVYPRNLTKQEERTHQAGFPPMTSDQGSWVWLHSHLCRKGKKNKLFCKMVKYFTKIKTSIK